MKPYQPDTQQLPCTSAHGQGDDLATQLSPILSRDTWAGMVVELALFDPSLSQPQWLVLSGVGNVAECYLLLLIFQEVVQQ